MGIKRSLLLVGFTLLLLVPSRTILAQDLQFQLDRTSRRVRARNASGKILYDLQQVVALLGLELLLSAGGHTAEIRGPRGRLIVTEGRPLMRYRQEYVLLSSAVLRAANGDWFAPQDILEKGLAQILDGKLERIGRRSYRLETLDSNVVRVDIVNYPDHVAVIFSSPLEIQMRVREYRRYLRVRFEGFAIEPQITKVTPNQELIREVRFDSFDRGSFEIVKGSEFFTHRQYSLSGPDRQVVGVYGRPVSTVARGPGNARVKALDPPPARSDSRPRSAPRLRPDLEAPEFFSNRDSRIITIDPGHGGEDLGVMPTQEILESQLVWAVTQQVQEFLGLTPFETRLTRGQGMNPSVDQRSSQANSERSRAFVSVHLGASEVSAARGPVVYTHRYFDRAPSGDQTWLDWNEGQRETLPASRRLAAILQRKLNLVFGVGNDLAEAPLAVLAPVKAPAVMIELGFITNGEDKALLQSPDFRRQIAAAIASGLEEFLQ